VIRGDIIIVGPKEGSLVGSKDGPEETSMDGEMEGRYVGIDDSSMDGCPEVTCVG